MLHILPHAHQFPSKSKLLLDRLPRRNFCWGPIRPEEVPGVESREVLQCAQELIAAHRRGNKFEVVRYRGVVDEGVGDHGCSGACEAEG